MKRARVIGTTENAVSNEEKKLNRRFPPSFVDWLMKNNGLAIGGVHIYPVKDERDLRKTWASISHNFENGWAAWLENFEDESIEFSHLLPFADYGTGDYYCFDYSSISKDGECPIVRWSHETGECEFRAHNFSEFEQKVIAGEFAYD